MMGDHNNPFGYSLLTYVWVLILGCVGGAVRYLNHMRGFRFGAFLIDMVSASFTSLITFWLCESGGISGPLQAALIGISGLMGSRAWKEFEALLRAKFGLPPASDQYRYDYYRSMDNIRSVNDVSPSPKSVAAVEEADGPTIEDSSIVNGVGHQHTEKGV